MPSLNMRLILENLATSDYSACTNHCTYSNTTVRVAGKWFSLRHSSGRCNIPQCDLSSPHHTDYTEQEINSRP
jgi:hypothetical protein